MNDSILSEMRCHLEQKMFLILRAHRCFQVTAETYEGHVRPVLEEIVSGASDHNITLGGVKHLLDDHVKSCSLCKIIFT
jgi:hypothetical protein